MIITGKNLKKDARFSRRDILQRLGLSAACIPLLHSDKLFAQGSSGFPKRMVCVTMNNGNNPNDFHSFHSTGSVALKPLEPWKDKVTTIRGLGLKVMVDKGQRWDGHYSHPCALSGSHSGGQFGSAQNASVDQMVSDHIAKTVNLTRPLLNLGVRSERDGRDTSWRAAGQPNRNEVSSASLYADLFSSAAVPTNVLDETMIRNASVLDYLGKDLERFAARLGTEDKIKIAAHLNSIRELETQLQAESAATSGPSCQAPDVDTSTQVPARMNAMFKMLAVALKCDYTRVATMELYDNGGGNGNTFPWIGVNRDYHMLAHAGQSADKAKVDQWLFQQVAILAAELDATDEGGLSALDNSVISIGNDMNTGDSHDVSLINYALIGSAGGALRTGMALNLNGAHNTLLTSLANAMGLEIDRVGTRYSGNIAQLMA